MLTSWPVVGIHLLNLPCSAYKAQITDHECLDWHAVYHVAQDGWTKARGVDVGKLHFQYYAEPEAHACHGTPPI